MRENNVLQVFNLYMISICAKGQVLQHAEIRILPTQARDIVVSVELDTSKHRGIACFSTTYARFRILCHPFLRTNWCQMQIK